MLTKVATGVAGTVLGDAIAQYSQHTMALSAQAKASQAKGVGGERGRHIHVTHEVAMPHFK